MKQLPVLELGVCHLLAVGNAGGATFGHLCAKHYEEVESLTHGLNFH